MMQQQMSKAAAAAWKSQDKNNADEDNEDMDNSMEQSMKIKNN